MVAAAVFYILKACGVVGGGGRGLGKHPDRGGIWSARCPETKKSEGLKEGISYESHNQWKTL
jgi:hypothetical protein